MSAGDTLLPLLREGFSFFCLRRIVVFIGTPLLHNSSDSVGGLDIITGVLSLEDSRATHPPLALSSEKKALLGKTHLRFARGADFPGRRYLFF